MMPKKKSLYDLPADVTERKISKYLSVRDKLTLAEVSSGTFGLFRVSRQQVMVDKLLLLVMQGKQNQAEIILKIYPEFLEKTGTALYGDRKAINTTAFKYSCWAHDLDMIEMISNYLPVSSQIKQLKELEDEGITMTFNGILQEHQHYFDLSDYRTALDTYVRNFNLWNYEQCKTFSHNEIGTKQRALPMNILQSVYFNPECEQWSFHENPRFYEKKLERRNTFYNAIIKENQDWEEAMNPSNPVSARIGHNMVIYWVYDMSDIRKQRGDVKGVDFAIGKGNDWRAGSTIYAGGRDLKLIDAFNEASCLKFEKFKQALEDLEQKPNDDICTVP